MQRRIRNCGPMAGMAAGLGLAATAQASVIQIGDTSVAESSGVTVSFSHVVTGDSPFLAVGVAAKTSSVDVSSITYGGVALTLRDVQTATAVSGTSTWIFTLDGVTLPTGSNTLSVTMSGNPSNNFTVGAVTLFQTGGFDNATGQASNTGTSNGGTISTSITTGVDNAMILDILAAHSAHGGNLVPQTPGQTEVFDNTPWDGRVAVSTLEAGPAGSHTMAWLLSGAGSSRHAHSLLSVAPDATPSSQTVLAAYRFSDNTLTSSDDDPNSVADPFTTGAGLTSVFRNRNVATGQSLGVHFGPGAGIDSQSEAAAVANEEYFSFMVSPEAGVMLNLTALSFDALKNSANDAFMFVRSNVDGFVSNLLDPFNQSNLVWESHFIDLSGGSFQNLAGPVEFRFYVYDTGQTGTGDFGWDLDNVVLYGSPVLPTAEPPLAAIPEPAAAGLVMLGFAGLLGRRRRS